MSEIITITDNSFNDLKTKGNPHINYSLQHNQYIQAGQTLGHVKMLTYLGGRVVGINKDNNIEMLILKDHDIKTCFYDSVNETPLKHINNKQ